MGVCQSLPATQPAAIQTSPPSQRNGLVKAGSGVQSSRPSKNSARGDAAAAATGTAAPPLTAVVEEKHPPKELSQATRDAIGTLVAAVDHQHESPIPAITKCILAEHTDVYAVYDFERILGKGNFGVVRLVRHKVTGEELACKSISKRKLVTPQDVEEVRREVQIMNHLVGHPNVTCLRTTFEDKNEVHLLMELCTGGELFDKIAAEKRFSEKAAAAFVRTIVSVVNHCHTMNVIHRDLKPENFLFSDKSTTAQLKATDFGLSRFFRDGEHLNEIVGSPYYVAPEVLQRKYSKQADIWSCGVILYILLCGTPPFKGDSSQAIFRSVLIAPLDLHTGPWLTISDGAKDIVRRMLQRDPQRRSTAEQVLSHPWLKENGLATDEPMVPEVLSRMRQFARMNKLKKEAYKVIAKSLPTCEIVGMKQMFEDIDKDASGNITVDELRLGLRQKGADLAVVEVQRILDDIDINGNSIIDYEEFLAATMHINKLNREENMIEAFKYFDADSSGFITRDELLVALSELGEVHAVVDAVLAEVDSNGDGKIDYEEFCAMMRRNDMEVLRGASKALRSHIIKQPKMTDSFQTDLDRDFTIHTGDSVILLPVSTSILDKSRRGPTAPPSPVKRNSAPSGPVMAPPSPSPLPYGMPPPIRTCAPASPSPPPASAGASALLPIVRGVSVTGPDSPMMARITSPTSTSPSSKLVSAAGESAVPLQPVSSLASAAGVLPRLSPAPPSPELTYQQTLEVLPQDMTA